MQTWGWALEFLFGFVLFTKFYRIFGRVQLRPLHESQLQLNLYLEPSYTGVDHARRAISVKSRVSLAIGIIPQLILLFDSTRKRWYESAWPGASFWRGASDQLPLTSYITYPAVSVDPGRDYQVPGLLSFLTQLLFIVKPKTKNAIGVSPECKDFCLGLWTGHVWILSQSAASICLAHTTTHIYKYICMCIICV